MLRSDAGEVERRKAGALRFEFLKWSRAEGARFHVGVRSSSGCGQRREGGGKGVMCSRVREVVELGR